MQKNKQKQNKQKRMPSTFYILHSTSRRGFSLMELMVAMFVFSVIMAAVVGVFAQSTSSFKNAKAIQKNLEDAQYAMSLMAKTIRTSSIVDPSSNQDNSNYLKIFDYSQDRCIKYRLDNSKLQIAKSNNTYSDYVVGAGVGALSAIDWCNNQLLAGTIYSDIISGFIPNGSFSSTKSTAGSVGRVTISMEVCAKDAICAGEDKVRIQTTVSLRDYEESGI